MRLLLVTDNLFLMHEVKHRILALGYDTPDVVFSVKNPDPEPFLAEGARVMDIKNNVDHLAQHYDLIFSVHCKQIFPAILVKTVRCVNLHPGLNPYNRGWFPQVFSIMNGLPLGATLHEMDEGVDSGPVIAQKEVPVYAHDTSKTAYDRVIRAELDLLDAHLPAVLSGNYETFQPAEGNYNSISDYRRLCEIPLDASATYGQVINHLRALTHEPYANAWFVDANGQRVYIKIALSPSEK
jgi:methionyl-tRNA formyltransferase